MFNHRQTEVSHIANRKRGCFTQIVLRKPCSKVLLNVWIRLPQASSVKQGYWIKWMRGCRGAGVKWWCFYKSCATNVPSEYIGNCQCSRKAHQHRIFHTALSMCLYWGGQHLGSSRGYLPTYGAWLMLPILTGPIDLSTVGGEMDL